MELTDRQRLVLAGLLLEMHEPVDQSGVDEAWEREIQDRIEEIDSGKAKGDFLSRGDARCPAMLGSVDPIFLPEAKEEFLKYAT